MCCLRGHLASSVLLSSAYGGTLNILAGSQKWFSRRHCMKTLESWFWTFFLCCILLSALQQMIWNCIPTTILHFYFLFYFGPWLTDPCSLWWTLSKKINTSFLSFFQHLRGPRRAAERLPDRGAALAAGGDQRGDPQKLHLLLLLGALHHGPLPELQGPRGQRRVRLGPQLVLMDQKRRTACTHT